LLTTFPQLPETGSLVSARWFAKCKLLALDKQALCRVLRKNTWQIIALGKLACLPMAFFALGKQVLC